MPYTPVDVGRRPVRNDVRDGLQIGAWQNARWNTVDLVARRAMCGVDGIDASAAVAAAIGNFIAKDAL